MTANLQDDNSAQSLSQEKVETAPVETEVKPVAPPQTEEATNENPNWRAFREARKKDRLEKEAAERKLAEKEAEAAALKAAMEAAFNRSQTQQPQYQYDQEETEDERIEKKVQAALAAREESYRRESEERTRQEMPHRLNQAYPDFKQVVSEENLDYLEFHYPEVARPLKRLGESYDKWSDIYAAVKKFVPNCTGSRQSSAKADANFSKPKSMSTTGITQPADSSSGARLSEERKAANWERMQRMLKGIG